MNLQFDIVVVGAGGVGLSTAYKLIQNHTDLKIGVIEKEHAVSQHQTGRNSGVIHSGIYYKPGSLKAKLCITGREELVSFCRDNGVAYDVCGKVIVAADEEELPRLDKILQTGLENGLQSIKKIDSHELKAIEPECKGVAAIYVPYTGIVDFKGVCQTLEKRINASPNGSVLLNHALLSISHTKNGYTLTTTGGTIQTSFLISCAGLFSDRLAKMEGLNPETKIVGFRGDYYDLAPHALHKVRNLIYPVPNPAFPFLGVHFTRMVQGGVECGPNAVFTFKREGYNKTDFNVQDTLDALTYSGTWKFFAKHWRFGLMEYKRAFSKALFLKTLQRLLPSLTMADLVPGRSGVRAMALNPDGTMVDDFAFAVHERSLHVLNAPSPAATACLAIGNEIQKLATQKFFC